MTNTVKLPTIQELETNLTKLDKRDSAGYIIHEAVFNVDGYDVVFTVYGRGSSWMSTDVLDTLFREDVLMQARALMREWADTYWPEFTEPEYTEYTPHPDDMRSSEEPTAITDLSSEFPPEEAHLPF